MIIANGAKRFSRRFHRVAAKRAVHMKIDKTRREIISVEIDDLIFPVRQGSLANRSDFSLFTTTSSPSRIPSGKIKRAFVKIIS